MFKTLLILGLFNNGFSLFRMHGAECVIIMNNKLEI
jgi:hypothetical protein